MREVYVIGVGVAKCGRYPDKGIEDLGYVACRNALKDAGIDPREIQGAFCGNVNNGMAPGQRVFSKVGILGIPTVNVENACASGSTAFHQAYLSVASGLYDVAIAAGVEKMAAGLLDLGMKDPESEMGLVVTPAWFAMEANRHMAEYGTTIEQISKVSVKNHRHAISNPFAQFQREFSLEEVLNSRMVADPLTLLNMCPNGDGAAATILCCGEKVSKYQAKAIRVAASVMGGGVYQSPRETPAPDLTTRTARKAYQIAGVGPEDLNVAEVHDCSSIMEMLECERLELCEKGEAGRLIDEGTTALGGKLPVNPSGGLLSRGHPIGATGLYQISEIIWQLRGEAGGRQVPNAKVGLTQNAGAGSNEMDGGTCNINIFMR
ncbi:MAG: thiolase family protein [Candidatus Tectomicrobia bacterium]|uniref:propanoyl-CoA C-acyltransferase n=1 Tax=Tectimicrobiota bacterium TaxID=2528274 RepID=A0A932CNR7_UNCTE|nr:thiolase family protein [Candidatus Tectomicrobia bacterium]